MANYVRASSNNVVPMIAQLKTKFEPKYHFFIESFTGFIMDDRADKVIDAGIHYLEFGYKWKGGVKKWIERLLKHPEYNCVTHPARTNVNPTQSLFVSENGLMTLFKNMNPEKQRDFNRYDAYMKIQETIRTLPCPQPTDPMASPPASTGSLAPSGSASSTPDQTQSNSIASASTSDGNKVKHKNAMRYDVDDFVQTTMAPEPIPEELIGKQGVYWGHMGVAKNGRRFITVGESGDGVTRDGSHDKHIPHGVIIARMKTNGYNVAKIIEDCILASPMFIKRKERGVFYKKGTVERKDVFSCATDEEVEETIRAQMKYVIEKFPNYMEFGVFQGVMTTYPQEPSGVASNPEVQVIHARTTEIEAQIRLAKAQEKTKIAEADAKVKSAEVKKGILDLIKAHPDKFDELVKHLA